MLFAAHRVLDTLSNCAAVAEQRAAAGYIEERLVDAERLDEVRITGQDGHEARRRRRIEVRARTQIHGGRTAAIGLPDRHRRVGALRARLATGPSRHAAP